ncbi:MAG: PHP domain-containing protein [Propionibacteriaceae bacterium]|nr:PHP domain-containing protein [Propionibacteriaceae bacterium]
MNIDLHTHSSISDGTDSVPELLDKARLAGIDVVALTDHDTMDGVDQGQEYGASIGIEVLRGMEISTHVEGEGTQTSVHLLAYGCQPQYDDLNNLLADLKEARDSRVPRMLEILDELGMPLTMMDVEAQSSHARVAGRPHIADAMVAHGYVASRDEAFHRYLGDDSPVYVKRYTPSLAEGLDIIHRSGGVGILAHPWGRGTKKVLSRVYLRQLVESHGLDGIEVDHVDHDDTCREELRALTSELGIQATGSSDYHGLGKTRNPLGVFTTPEETYQLLRSMVIERGGCL